jgi:glucan endo-1,3-beta-D-glucosidase
MKLFRSLTSTLLLTPVASKIYTGFNYGAFWGVEGNAKKAADFRDGFNYAKGLTSPVAFDSARLYSCITTGTKDEPTGAFNAAVETKTNLLLGFWITPGHKGDPLDDILNNELSALGKGFKTHGQALADLVIGLSVGNEDIFRSQDPGQVGVPAVEVSAAIKKVKDAVAASDFAAFMKDKPIGHVDTAQWAVVDGADFYGMTAYPYWANDTIENAKNSFHGSLEGVKQRAGNTPVWIAEMGWPVEGPQRGDAVASTDNLQKFWTEVGCTVVGMYNTFWFELLKDSTPDQPDWGLLDSVTHQSRIKDFSCPGAPQPLASAVLPASSSPSAIVSPSNPATTTLVTLVSQSPTPVSPTMATSAPSPPSTASDGNTIYISTTTVVTVHPSPSLPSTQPAYQLLSAPASPSVESGQSTTHVTQTILVTVPPTAPSAASSPLVEEEETVTTTVTSTICVGSAIEAASTEAVSVKMSSLDSQAKPPAGLSAQQPASIISVPSPTILAGDVPWCATVADISWNSQYLTIDGNPAGPDGKCTAPSTYTHPGASPLPIDVPWCVTVAEIAWDGQYVPVDAGPAGVDGKCNSPPTYTGLPYGSCQPTAPPTIATSGTVPAVSTTPSSTVAFPVSSNAAAPARPSSATPSSVAASVSQATGKFLESCSTSCSRSNIISFLTTSILQAERQQADEAFSNFYPAYLPCSTHYIKHFCQAEY